MAFDDHFGRAMNSKKNQIPKQTIYHHYLWRLFHIQAEPDSPFVR